MWGTGVVLKSPFALLFFFSFLPDLLSSCYSAWTVREEKPVAQGEQALSYSLAMALWEPLVGPGKPRQARFRDLS